ncbi:hypothetical protein BU23DRAFT_548589 [Bimuria novae-zelandiae CBS 107.79]|uniref:Uncharacterized protein n=1 Tax=Bimuria novae-zelandiae CBS 107.79 TaxID=1447943 RepID=A0A6A5W4L5_9PLEO|nr:hypothetical protein BU23DRAFT_548589 [Bimuria novae-zelandiae CBS 107.79]
MAYEGLGPYTIVGPSLRHSKTPAWVRLTCFYFDTELSTRALCALHLGCLLVSCRFVKAIGNLVTSSTESTRR